MLRRGRLRFSFTGQEMRTERSFLSLRGISSEHDDKMATNHNRGKRHTAHSSGMSDITNLIAIH